MDSLDFAEALVTEDWYHAQVMIAVDAGVAAAAPQPLAFAQPWSFWAVCLALLCQLLLSTLQGRRCAHKRGAPGWSVCLEDG